MADEPVGCEPVSAPKFPANREKNREFWKNQPFLAKNRARDEHKINKLEENSLGF
jgi:hypothetical protein